MIHPCVSETTILCRSTPTQVYVMKITCPTSNSLAVWQAWPCIMENCWMVCAVLTKILLYVVLFLWIKVFCVFFEAFFIRPFYKMMLQKPITLQDMESVVSELFSCKLINIHVWAGGKYSFLLVLFSGQWIFQFPDVDFGEWSNRLGFEVYRWWRALWTGVFSGFFKPAVCIFPFNHMILSCFHFLRLTSMNWSQVAQTSSSPMKTRKNTSSKELKSRFHCL